MEDGQNTVEEQEQQKEFTGNYIETFEREERHQSYPGRLVSVEQLDPHTLLINAENTTLEVKVFDHDILRFRYGNNGYFEDDFSYATDPGFQPNGIAFGVFDRGRTIQIKTDLLKVNISKNELRTRITDLNGHMIMEDEKGYHWEDEPNFGGEVVIMTKKKQDKENFYGLGDKTGKLNLLGTRRQLWGTDCYGYGNETDPVYKNIPFFMGLHHGRGYGVFMDNSFRSFFDFAHERKNAFSFWAQGGEMRYYFIYGPSLMKVAEKYTQITGKPEMPPKWSLGYQQSKWSYYPESVVRDIADEFRSRKIPCDVIHLDIDYMDGFRVFTWDKERFPDPAKLIADLKEQGFRTIVINDPGIKIDKNYKLYREGIEKKLFCTRADGALFKGSVWPGPCHFPDFTKPETREWWADQYEGLLAYGVDGVWNDMNEPAVFEEGTFPWDVRHDYDGHPSSHRKGHNVYGLQMARASYHGLKKYKPENRPFNITRSAFAGIQRYASVWTGDNVATWEHLKIANVQCQRLSQSGISFVGSDVGGFIGTPSGELYTRWIQLAVFHPFFRTHSSGDHGDKEPWVFEDGYLDVVRDWIGFRYELLPYIYTAFWQYATQGTPMIKSMVFADQQDVETHFRQHEFIFGHQLLVCPVVEEGSQNRKMYIPNGTWYDFWSNEKLTGGKEYVVETPLEHIPIYVRSGSVVPLQPRMQYVDEFEFDTLDLHVYQGKNETVSELYEDEGDGYRYHHGLHSLKKFTTAWKDDQYHIWQDKNGWFDPSYTHYRILLKGFQKPASILLDGNEMISETTSENGVYEIKISKVFHEIRISF